MVFLKKYFSRWSFMYAAWLVSAVATLFYFGAILFPPHSTASTANAPNPSEVAAVTGGVISRTSPVQVVFTREQDVTRPVPQSAFIITPRVRGGLAWQDAYTLTFTPERALEPGTHYRAVVDLAKLGGGGEVFSFTFETRVPTVEVTFDPVKIDAADAAMVSGVFSVDEPVLDVDEFEDIFDAPKLGAASWKHEQSNDDGMIVHRFAFAPVQRQTLSYAVEVAWSGKPVGAKYRGKATVLVPGTGRFEVMEIRQEERGIIQAVFSAPLKKNQDLRGFVSLSGNTNVRYSVDSNIMRVFSDDASGLPDGAVLSIQDIPDIKGNVLYGPAQFTVHVLWDLPKIRFTGSGTILPTSQGSTMAIETRNVTGVLVEAFRVYGDNMVQFLQVNKLQGERDLERVGEAVWVKGFDFSWSAGDKNRWTRRGLDLSELARKYPGELFHIRMSFRQRHIKYECTASHADFSTMHFPDDTFPVIAPSDGREPTYWDNYDEQAGFNWYKWYQNRNDPCHPAFYMNFGDNNITVGRNVLVSDLGLLAKKSLDGTLFVATTNLKTAQPVANIAVKIINYQGRELHTLRTGADGMAALPATENAWFMYAEAPTLGRAWLKINDSSALATSHFNVAGDRPVTGIRGMLYGERGVWRPGDDIYLTFLLSDAAGTLPANHPVMFELEDPRGQITVEQTYTTSVDGFYPISIATAENAPTGDWTARVRVGGAVFNKNIKVETVMPNRLKMELDFGDKTYLSAEPAHTTLSAAWLYGAPSPGLKSDVSVSFSTRETAFDAYPDYNFRDPSRTVSSERYSVFEGKLDETGNATFDVRLNPGETVPGKLTARFMTRVFEPTGAFSSQQTSVEFSPYRRYVGVRLPQGDTRDMLLTDVDHTANIVIVDAEGKPVSDRVNLECALYELSWRWWWDKGEGEGAEFSQAMSHTPVAQEIITADGGKASWQFQVKYPHWGRYLIVIRDKEGGHSAASITYIDWPGWAGRANGQTGSAAMLALTAEKPNYIAGDKIAVTFPSNKDAVALAVVEKGGQILRREWIPCADALTRYEFSAEPAMMPNIYVHITLLQQHLQTRNDLPLRLYGITPVSVDDPATRLAPRIEAAEQWAAESTASFTVREESGRPMTYTAVVVDEGLLGLTRYSLPNPRQSFYTKEASFIKSWDLYSEIMGAYAGQLETLLAIGGGEDLLDDSAKKTQRFKPVARYFGPYTLKAGETKTETFPLPPYIGAVRIMVLAASALNEKNPANSGRAYGTAQQSVTVSSDIMVFQTAPRTLSPNDEAVIPVTVASYREGARTVQVEFKVSGNADLAARSSTQTLVFEKSGEQVVEWRIRAGKLPGPVNVTVAASSKNLKTAVSAIDLAVRSTAIPVTVATTQLIAANETWKPSLTLPGQSGTNTAVVELSRLPPLGLETRLDYLISYPHGCVEQTTSALFPQLYLDKALALEKERMSEIRGNINAGIDRLKTFQTAQGGFSYWPGDSSPHAWGTNYAGHFLVEARRAGYAIPESLISKWLSFQKTQSATWTSGDGNGNEIDQAYRLYTLALAGSADLGSMNRLREQKKLSAMASWRLAAAYWYAGQRDITRAMITQLNGVDLEIVKYRELNGTFGSELRDKAMILETLLLSGETQNSKRLFEEIAAALSGEAWLSTQETAYSLIAVAPYMRSAGGEVFTVDCALGDRSETATFRTPIARVDMGGPTGESAAFQIHNRSATPVYARISAKGFPAEGKEQPISRGLSLQVEYRDLNGGVISPDALTIGDDMEVRLTVRNTQTHTVPEIALIHALPASWELLNYRLGAEAPTTGDGDKPPPPPAASYTYQDIRDDRVMTYFDLSPGAERVVHFYVNRAYSGAFFRPAIQAYAMYDESISALIPGAPRE